MGQCRISHDGLNCFLQIRENKAGWLMGSLGWSLAVSWLLTLECFKVLHSSASGMARAWF